jgi:hypothetical protein
MNREIWHRFREKDLLKSQTSEMLRKPNRSGPFVWIVSTDFETFALSVVADDAVSRAYGGRKCGTQTPSALRPGGARAQNRFALPPGSTRFQTDPLPTKLFDLTNKKFCLNYTMHQEQG